MIEIKNLKKIYKITESNDVVALDNVNLSFANCGLVFILGPFGSGKTTLLNLIGGIDDKTSGEIYFDGTEFSKLSMEEYRRDVVSFVFQEYNLLQNLNVFDNISIVTSSANNDEKEKRVKEILVKIGLEGYEYRKISELSGGQKQRIAIGRALAKGCNILLCDEPTGNLDSSTSKEIFELLKNISKEKLVIVVSHNQEMAEKYGDRIISIYDGKVSDDKIVNDITPIEKKQKEKNTMSFSSMFKYAMTILLSYKFKTIVSTSLLILSLLSTCLAIIFLTYDSEYINAKTSANDSIEYFVEGGSDNQPNASYYGSEISSSDGILSNDICINGYSIQGTTFYIINESNKKVLENYSFYFRDELTDGSCYITDYYLKYVLSVDDNYTVSTFESINDLKGEKVYYQDVEQYSISGIIKTDYEIFYDEPESKKYKTLYSAGDWDDFTNSLYSDYSDYYAEFTKKTYYEYDVIFGNSSTFENMSLGFNSLYYGESSDITLHQGNNDGNLSSLTISFLNNNSCIEFYMKDGYFGTTSSDGNENKINLGNNEIVISPYLYDYVFGTKTDWDAMLDEYLDRMDYDLPISKTLDHIGETMSICIVDENKTISITDVKVVGVLADPYANEDPDYTICCDENLNGLTRFTISKCVVKLVDWKNIKNKYQTLSELRKACEILTGAKFNAVYGNEFIFDSMSYFFTGLAIILSLISCVTIVNLVIHMINDHKREIGILFASGCKKKEIKFMYLIPITVITFLSLIISCILVSIGCFIFNKLIAHKGVGYLQLLSLNWQSVIILFVSVILIIIFSFLPLNNYLKKKPIEIIK